MAEYASPVVEVVKLVGATVWKYIKFQFGNTRRPNYIAELSLLEYSMLHYAPSLIAASAIFLAKFILAPSRRPWNSTLHHYTLYKPSDLLNCVNDLHRLCCNNQDSALPAVREKYSQHKYKCVAKKYCPPSMPPEFFHNQMH